MMLVDRLSQTRTRDVSVNLCSADVSVPSMDWTLRRSAPPSSR